LYLETQLSPVYGVNLPNLFGTDLLQVQETYIVFLTVSRVFQKDIEGHIKQMNVPPNDISLAPAQTKRLSKEHYAT
jgi:hypothetical protein